MEEGKGEKKRERESKGEGKEEERAKILKGEGKVRGTDSI